MSNLLDHVLVATVVVLSFLFVLYALGSARTKKWMLAQVARYLGLRALLLVMPKQCGCDGCSTATNRSTLADKLKNLGKTK